MEIPSEMQHQAMGYDRAATMFSPDGHLLQVEYAEKTVRLGSSSIGLVCKDGLVMIADRRHRDKLVVTESMRSILILSPLRQAFSLTPAFWLIKHKFLHSKIVSHMAPQLNRWRLFA